MNTNARPQLIGRLAEALPKHTQYRIHHLSTPPTRCAAIFFGTPGQKPEKTYCESHFLSVSISLSPQILQVFAIEILIYTTEHLTTLFVSKADSTGYLHLLDRPKGAPSPLKTISSVFVAHLVEKRTRPRTRLVVSLFARAQDQYLFPGSVENAGKHVLDDRGLIKWWCRVLDPVLRRYPVEKNDSITVEPPEKEIGIQLRSKGYLIVPGCDLYETRSFLPPSAKYESGEEARWASKDPLPLIRKFPGLPPRCLIPHFPDDPKARFLDELDEELPENGANVDESPSQRCTAGRWRSVRTLEQFWEMMAFRQECSSGRLVGFIWGVFTPRELLGQSTEAAVAVTHPILPTPLQPEARDVILAAPDSPIMPSQDDPSPLSPIPSSPVRPLGLRNSSSLAPKPRTKAKKKRKLTGPIPNRQPRIKGSIRPRTFSQPERTKYYFWPSSSRGQIVLQEKDYKRANELLLRLDYANEKTAVNGTERWIDEVAVAAGRGTWGVTVEGTKDLYFAEETRAANPTSLNMDVVRKRKRVNIDGGVQQPANPSDDNATGPKVMDAGLIRKKPKISPYASQVTSSTAVENGVNVLCAGLVRKKVKT